MIDLFSDIFTYRDNFLTRLDARTKLIVSLTAITTTILSNGETYPGVIFLISAVTVILLRTPLKVLLQRLSVPFLFVFALFVLQMFTTGSTPVFTVSFYGHDLTATFEGYRRGLIIAARVLGAVSVMTLLGIVTPAHEIFRALRSLGVSRTWVEIAMLMYRYIFVLLDTASNIAVAQKLRLGYQGVRKTLSSVGVLSGAVLLRSFDQSLRTQEAMILRGYGGDLYFGSMPKMSRSELLLTAIASLMLCGAFLLANRVL